jgi:hypothetical protein
MNEKEKKILKQIINVACIGIAMKMADEIYNKTILDITSKKTSKKVKNDGKRI